jgi:MoaA/NifB/PqqE/SkfB family radical SAM enzyme
MRPDIVEFVTMFYKKCAPAIINIPTNGMLWPNIIKKAPEIAKNCPKAEVVINLSLDQWGERHEQIRGVPRNWEFSMKAWKGLKKAKGQRVRGKEILKNLTLGIHTVISNFNVKEFPEFHKKLLTLKPDSYITEIAEERVELDTKGTGITPDYDDYSRAIDSLIEDMQKMFKERKYKGVARVAAAFRLQYYQNVKKWLLEKRQVIPCFAGWASAQISPDGDVWECCIEATELGNLRKNDYNFKKIWFGEKAKQVRKRIKNKGCSCPLANASYTNMLHHVPTMIRAGAKMLLR